MPRPNIFRSLRVGLAATLSVLALGFVSGTATAHAQEQDPNYLWRSDPLSKILAAKPFSDYVLHRVPGSFHDAPRIPEASNQALTRGNSLYGPGTPIYVTTKNGSEVMCTVAAAGYGSHGNKYALTAGHCGEVGDAVKSADSWQVGPSGTITHVNKDLDFALIELGSNTEISRSYNGITLTSLGGAPVQPGGVVCKQGVASGHTCGVTLHDWQTMNISQVCALQGDSGAPVMEGGRLIGILNGGMLPFNFSCVSPLQGALHSPTGSVRADAVLAALPDSFRLPEH